MASLEQRLYWTDIPTGRLFRYDPASGTHDQIYSGRTVGGFTFRAGGGLLLFMDRGSIASWRDGCLSELLPELPEESNSRFNDVIADPVGRVFCGTMPTGQAPGRLYRLDTDGTLQTVLHNVHLSNGMAFSADGAFFHTDTLRRQISRYDYDAASGKISDVRVFASFSEEEGLPDGITIDADGHLWAAFWGGGAIARLREDGGIAERFFLPVSKTSSLTFGGAELNDLYVTTAGGNQKDADCATAGGLFRMRSIYHGRPENFANITASSIVPVKG